MNSNILSKISFGSLLLVVVLLPVFFLPFTTISVEASKGLFLVVGLIVSLIFWIIVRFSDGKVTLPKSLPLLAGLGIVVAVLLSASFSGAVGLTFFGTLLDVGTFWFIFAGFLLMVMSSIIFKDPKNARIVLFGTIFSSAIVIIFQVLHLFLTKYLAFGVLVNKTDNIVGSWNALGIFAGFFVVASLFAIEFFPTPKRTKLALSILSIIAILLIAIVNFGFVWQILGVFALLIFVYKISINATKSEEEEIKKAEFPVFSFAIVLVSLFFFMSSGFIGGLLPSRLAISNNEISPSLLSTISITKSIIKSNPVFGIGPNRFSDAWAMHKPEIINATQFWDVAFSSGSGLLPTLVSTTGIVGLLAWVLFLGLFIFTGVKWLFLSIKNNVSLETVSFFFLSLYLFASSFFYFSGIVLFFLAFVFAGVFIGLIASSRKNGEISVSFLDDHRKSFFFMLSLVLIMIVSAAVGFKYIQRFISVPYFTKTLSTDNIPDAEVSIGRAVALNSNDLYLRTYSQVYLLKLNQIVSESTEPSDADKANLQASLDQAISSSQIAINYNNKNYLNHQLLGSVFQTAGAIGVKDAYSRAFESYAKASELNPVNPRLKLTLATISSALSDTKKAREYANEALVLKPNYIDALVVLAQISKNEGKTSEAIEYGQKALNLSPGNKDLIKYVDSLRNGTTTTEIAPVTTDTSPLPVNPKDNSPATNN